MTDKTTAAGGVRLELRQLGKRFGPRKVLRHNNLNVAPGEFIAIVGRSAEPALAYGSDEDNLFGIDPESLQGDLGSDPVAFARKRIGIARDLLRRLEARPAAEADHPTLRRGVSYALRDVARVSGTLLRQIGGLRTLRDAPGTGRDPLTPVPAAQQRAAFDTLVAEVLSPDSLTVSPGLQRRLAPDYLERADALFGGAASVATDFTPLTQLSDLQRGVLAQLMSEGVAVRLLDGAAKASDPAQSLTLAELNRRLDAEVWADLASGHGDIPAARRALQREHTTRLIGLLMQPAQVGRVELRTHMRRRAEDLLARLRSVRYRSGWSAETAAPIARSRQDMNCSRGIVITPPPPRCAAPARPPPSSAPWPRPHR